MLCATNQVLAFKDSLKEAQSTRVNDKKFNSRSENKTRAKNDDAIALTSDIKSQIPFLIPKLTEKIGRPSAKKKKATKKRPRAKPKRSSARGSIDAIRNSNLLDPDETQVSTVDECQSETADRQDIGDNLDDENESFDLCVLDKSNDILEISADLTKLVKREFDCRTLCQNFSLKKRKIFEELFGSELNHDTGLLSRISNPSIEFKSTTTSPNMESLATLPRTFSKRNARFELPVDVSSLEETTPLDYLKRYARVTGSNILVYGYVFEKYAKEQFIEVKDMLMALNSITGQKLEQNSILDLLINLEDVRGVDFDTWCGICALCERIFEKDEKSLLIYTNRSEDEFSYEIEYLDFKLLQNKIGDLNINDKLLKLLTLINQSLFYGSNDCEKNEKLIFST